MVGHEAQSNFITKTSTSAFFAHLADLRQRRSVISLLEVQFHILQSLTLAEIVIILKKKVLVLECDASNRKEPPGSVSYTLYTNAKNPKLKNNRNSLSSPITTKCHPQPPSSFTISFRNPLLNPLTMPSINPLFTLKLAMPPPLIPSI